MRFLIRNRDSRYSAPSMRSSAPKGDPDRQAVEWTQRSEEFVKRAAFVVVAVRAVHEKRTDDRAFADLLPTVMAAADPCIDGDSRGLRWVARAVSRELLEPGVADVVPDRARADGDAFALSISR
jgi:hypothetical protein